MRALHVTIENIMPLSLWDDGDPSGDSLKAPAGRPLPGLRAAGVAWDMPPYMLVPILSESLLLKEVE